MLKHCLDRYKTHEMCDKAVNDFLPTLNSVPDCFIVTKMLDKLDNVVFFNDGIGLDDIDSDFVPLFSDDMELNTIDLNNIKLDDNFDEHDPKTLIYVRPMAYCNRYKQSKLYQNGDKQIINTCSMVSNNMVGFVHVRKSTIFVLWKVV